ncbi:MAG: hypothetical protein P4L38_08055 [Syntrophaceae bacterium]|nr:hypothetical protein [Syntrophaceae bacterium]
MNKRRSHTTKLLAKLLVIFLMIGVVSPGWVWCYDYCGRVAIDFGCRCNAIPISGPPVDHESLSNRSVQCCVSCIDSPAFVVEAKNDISYLTVTLIRDAASVEPALESNTQGPVLPSKTYLTQYGFQTYLLLCTIKSITLLI